MTENGNGESEDITDKVERIYYNPGNDDEDLLGCKNYFLTDDLKEQKSVYMAKDGSKYHGRIAEIKKHTDEDVKVHIALPDHGVYINGKIINRLNKIYVALLDIVEIKVEEKPKKN